MAASVKKKVFSFIGLTLVGIVVGIVISFYIMLVLSVPQTDGEITLTGLNSQVKILFDGKGIPQIYAENEKDAYFALGYQHAADRMFQMDLSRRVAQGKLSELLGSVTEAIDEEQIKIGHYRIAVETEKNLSDKNKKLLQAYADGVNRYSDICKSLPFEYRFLPVDFVKWTVTDCLALLSFQTWYSNSLMNRDSFYNRLVEKVGQDKAQTLIFPYPKFAPVTVDSVTKLSTISPSFKTSKVSYNYSFKLQPDNSSSIAQKYIAELYFKNRLSSFKMSEASNAWVIAPSKSENGSAMLASDPHLELGRLPQFWYAAGIHIEKSNTDAFGITTAGLPFFVMGHNKSSAWAFTAGGNDIVDYKTIRTNSDGTQYLSENGWKVFRVDSTEHINISIDSPITIVTKLSDYGVVMEENDSTAVVMHWVGQDVSLDKGVSNAFNLVNTKSYEQFQNIVTNFGALDANYMYADSFGNIGYQLSTPLPIRKNSSTSILPDALGSQIPFNFLPLDATPHVLNPEIGWIANCNNKPDNSKNTQGFYFADRVLRIQELLNSKEKFTIDDMKNFQFDLTDRYMANYANEFAQVLSLLGEDKKAALMRSWDGNSDTLSYNALLCTVYLDELKKDLFEDELGDLYRSVPSKWVENFTSVESDGWFDNINTPEIETAIDITQKAMKHALEIVGEKTWGDFQTLQMKHPLSIIPIVSSALHLETEPIPRGGTPGTLNSSFARKKLDGTYVSVAGVSMRLLVDFSDLDATTIVLPAGNSGNPMSEHFFDFYNMWRTNERWTVPISDDKINAGAKSTLTLKPKN